MTARHRRQGRSSSAQVYRDRTISEGWQKLRFCVYRLGCIVTLLGVISPPPLQTPEHTCKRKRSPETRRDRAIPSAASPTWQKPQP